jgi:CRISPR system Cascade subunit CasD
MANTLFLRLEGPMQSWGERSQWAVRDSRAEPTKSGVVGLLACARGINTDGDLRQLSQQVRIGVRCDRPGKPLTDYHTIGGGFEKPMLLQADGKLKRMPNTDKPHIEQTWRTYLHDASFLVAVRAEPTLVEILSDAIQNPHWPIYLGRKSCPPSFPLFAGVGNYTSLEDALMAWGNPVWALKPVLAVIECSPTEPEAEMCRDEMFVRSHIQFAPRYARAIEMNVHVPSEEVYAPPIPTHS